MTYDLENSSPSLEQVHIVWFLFGVVVSAISWWSDLLVEELGGLGENHRPVASQ